MTLLYYFRVKYTLPSSNQIIGKALQGSHERPATHAAMQCTINGIEFTYVFSRWRPALRPRLDSKTIFAKCIGDSDLEYSLFRK